MADAAPPPVSQLTAVEQENKNLMEEIQKLMLHNTKLQRELMTLNATREHIITEGHDRVAALTDELKQVDTELGTVRNECDRIIQAICEHNQASNLRSLGDLTADIIEEEDHESDHSTASTASTSSFHSASRGDPSLSRSGGTTGAGSGRPPLASSKKMSIDIDEVRVPKYCKSISAASADRDTIMNRITRSVKKAQSMPQMHADARPSIQHALATNSPMLAYKANAMLKATQSHLNNFRRHSGPYRQNRDTVVL